MKGTSFIQEFKDFAMRGNVIDMAVGVIIGGAFGKIVSSLVGDIFMPLIGLVVGGVNFNDLKWNIREAYTNTDGVEVAAATLNYGTFLQTAFDFICIALCIFLFIKLLTKLHHKKEEASIPPTEPTNEEKLLTEIRDLLKAKHTTL
jgi:large conductance mechanosensitive channel